MLCLPGRPSKWPPRRQRNKPAGAWTSGPGPNICQPRSSTSFPAPRTPHSADPARQTPVSVRSHGDGSFSQCWWGGTFLAYLHRSALSVATPSVGNELGLNSAVTGVLLSAFVWSYLVAQMPSSWLADRFGVGRVYATGFVGWFAAAALTGLPNRSEFVLRLFTGAGQRGATRSKGLASGSHSRGHFSRPNFLTRAVNRGSERSGSTLGSPLSQISWSFLSSYAS